MEWGWVIPPPFYVNVLSKAFLLYFALFCFRFAFFAFRETPTLLQPRGLQPFAHFKSKTARLPFFYATKKDFAFVLLLVCFFCFPKTAYFTRATGLVAVCTFQKQNSSTYYFLRATRDTERSTQKVSTTRRLYLLNKYLPSIYLLSIYILYYRGDERTFEEPKAKVFNTSHQLPLPPSHRLPLPRWQSSSASSSCGGRTRCRSSAA